MFTSIYSEPTRLKSLEEDMRKYYYLVSGWLPSEEGYFYSLNVFNIFQVFYIKYLLILLEFICNLLKYVLERG